ncbi:MAG: hypothetical protein V3W19_11990 [Desulfatiglandales bacterium]
MTWSKTPPVEPGWYWWSDEIGVPPDYEPRYVYLSFAGLMTGNDEVDLHVSPPEDLGGIWYSIPIAPPENK